MVIDVNTEYLIQNLVEFGLKESDIFLLLDRLQGLRVYINKKEVFYYKLKKRYFQLKGYLPKEEIVKILSKEFEKSKDRIRAIIKEIEKESFKKFSRES